MEADFQREYSIDLSHARALRRMSWRRFLLLVRGLGPQSATAMALRSRMYDLSSGKPKPQVETVETREGTLAALGAMFGRASRGKEPH